MVLVGPVEPIEARTQAVPLVGHSRVEAMNEAERRAFIDRGIADYRVVEDERWRQFENLTERSKVWRL